MEDSKLSPGDSGATKRDQSIHIRNLYQSGEIGEEGNLCGLKLSIAVSAVRIKAAREGVAMLGRGGGSGDSVFQAEGRALRGGGGHTALPTCTGFRSFSLS